MTKTFRTGDLVLIQAEVVSNPFEYQGKMTAKLRIEPFNDVFVQVTDLKMARPNIRVGDTVEWMSGGSPYRGEVLAISGEHLWVGRDCGSYSTVWMSNAARLDPDAATSETTGGEVE